MEFRFKYEYSKSYGSKATHIWSIIGKHGAMHLHINNYSYSENLEKDTYSGGLETHYRSPPDYMANDAPSSDNCWLLKSPCWHDGTSLYVEEHLIPFWLQSPHDHDRMFDKLKENYYNTFK